MFIIGFVLKKEISKRSLLKLNIATLYIYRALEGLVDRIYIIYLNNILIYLEDKN